MVDVIRLGASVKGQQLMVTPVKQPSPTRIMLTPLTPRQRRKRVRARLPKALRVLTSPITTVALGAALATLLAPAAVAGAALGAARATGRFAIRRPITTFLGIPTAAGALVASPTLRGLITPAGRFRFGKEVGVAVEDPRSFLEKIGAIGREVAPVVVPAALVGGAIIAGRRAVRRARERRAAPAIPGLAPAVIGGAPFVPLPPGLSAEPSIATTPEPVAAKPTDGRPMFTNIIQIQNVI